jgi:putative membrane protein
MKFGTNGLLGGTAAVVLTLCACSRQDRAGADSAADTTANRVGAAVDTAASRVGAAADTAGRRMESAAGSVKRGGWTDASIFGLVGVASAGEIRESQLAVKKATSPAVKKYAQQLVNDHRALANQLKSLAAKLSVTPDTADDDVRDVMKDANDEIKDLTDKPAGADWDKKFIDNEIDDHKDLLDKLQDAAKNTSNTELRTAIEKATGKVQEHLTKAQSIKENELKS